MPPQNTLKIELGYYCSNTRANKAMSSKRRIKQAMDEASEQHCSDGSIQYCIVYKGT